MLLTLYLNSSRFSEASLVQPLFRGGGVSRPRVYVGCSCLLAVSLPMLAVAVLLPTVTPTRRRHGSREGKSMSTDIYHCAHEYCNQVPLCLCVLSLSLSLRPTPLHWFRELGLNIRSDGNRSTRVCTRDLKTRQSIKTQFNIGEKRRVGTSSSNGERQNHE
jgi:hypothetical protein